MPCSVDNVRKITGSKLPDDTIQCFIDAAECILLSIQGCTTQKGITDECLDKACAFLSAHLLSVSSIGDQSKTKKKETFENYSVEYAMGAIKGDGLMGTTYGQTANALTQGCLAEADKRNPSICFFG